MRRALVAQNFGLAVGHGGYPPNRVLNEVNGLDLHGARINPGPDLGLGTNQGTGKVLKIVIWLLLLSRSRISSSLVQFAWSQEPKFPQERPRSSGYTSIDDTRVRMFSMYPAHSCSPVLGSRFSIVRPWLNGSRYVFPK